jgi:hypothetical protein
MTTLKEKIEILMPYLALMDQNVFEQFYLQLGDNKLRSNDYFFQQDLPVEERIHLSYLLKLWQVEDLFSNKIAMVQREMIIKTGLLGFDSNGQFSIDNLSSYLRFDFIPEHMDQEGRGFSPDREFLYTDMRRIFREYGDDVTLSDLFASDQLEQIAAWAKSGTFDLSVLPHDISSMLIREPLSNDAKEVQTALGLIVLRFAPIINAGMPYNMPIRELLSLYYNPPDSYERIVREYYDLTDGFIYISNDLLKRGDKIFRELGIRPSLNPFIEYGNDSYPEFADYLVVNGVMTAEEVTRLQSYYIMAVNRSFQKVAEKLQYFVYIVALLLKVEQKSVHRYYFDLIQTGYLKKLQGLWLEIHNNTRKKQASNSSRKVAALVVKEKTLRFNCMIRDFSELLRENLLAFCVFYDILFDGKSKLKNQRQNFRPANEAINDMLVFTVNCIAPDGKLKKTLELSEFGFAHKVKKGGDSISGEQSNKIATPLNIASKYVEMLTGTKIKDPRKTYHNWLPRFDVSRFESTVD